MKETILELDEEAFDALVSRLTEAKEHGIALSAEDTQLLLDALITLAHLQERLSSKDVTLHKLRKLLGIAKSSEKMRDILNKNDEDASSDKSAKSKANPKPNKRPKPKSKPVKPEVCHHKHANLSKGDLCPECQKGKLTKVDPGQLLRIRGNTAFVSELHLSERFRCNACGTYYTAKLPEKVLADGGSNQKYGYTARTTIALHKYFMGSPFYRQESLQQLLGTPVPASSQFDQVEYVANDFHPIFNELKQSAADAIDFYIDDTANLILDQESITKKNRSDGKERLRTGVNSSGLIAQTEHGHPILLFDTCIGHAGEFLDDILQLRSSGLSPPLVMSDALSSNFVTQEEIVISLCNAHARRGFVDVLSHFPEEVEDVLERYSLIWKYNNEVEEKNLPLNERMEYHQEHSLPVMESIQSWGLEKLNDGAVSENSGLGKAISYFNRHYVGLTRFCTYEGAKLDNNLMEQGLKIMIRNRKNAHFFKTLAGAGVADVLVSIIETASRAGANVYHYFNEVQRNQDKVKRNPKAWMPWNYEENLTN